MCRPLSVAALSAPMIRHGWDSYPAANDTKIPARLRRFQDHYSERTRFYYT